jgi:hypothetical protein
MDAVKLLTSGEGLAVEPITHTLTARLRPLKMCREDLDQLLALFQKGCARVTLSDNTNRYESLGEMKEYVGAKIKNIDIQGEKPGVHFLLNRSEVVYAGASPSLSVFNELRTEETTESAEALFYKVKDFLVAHQRPRVRIPLMILAGIAFIAFLVFIGNLETLKHRGQSTGSLNMELIVIVAVMFGSVLISVVVENSIILETKRNSQSFWAANREKIILLIVGGVIGSFFTILTHWVTIHLIR